MNLNQFTQKSVDAIQAAQQLAGERQNQQIRQEHLLLCLLEQKEGLIPQLMQKIGIDPAALRQKLTAAVERLAAAGFRLRCRADVPFPGAGAGSQRSRKNCRGNAR